MLASAGQSVDDDANSETQADQRPPLTLWVNNACPPHEPLVITTLRVNVSATILQTLFITAKFEMNCLRNVQQWYNYNTQRISCFLYKQGSLFSMYRQNMQVNINAEKLLNRTNLWSGSLQLVS